MAAGPSTLQDASWQDRAFISITKKDSGQEISFAGLTSEIDLPDNSKDFDAQPVMNGGNVRENSAQEAAEIGMTLYPIGVLTGDGSSRPEGLSEWFYSSGDISESGEASRFENSLNRYDFRVAILWTNVTDSENSSSPITAAGAVDTSTEGPVKAALREVYEDCQLTGYNPDFGDQVFTAEVTFKCAPYDETGAANMFEESTQDTSTDTLPALGDYGNVA